MEMQELLHALGNRIRTIRKAKGISQENLAELAGLHPTYISNIERGKVNASIYSYYSVASALDIQLEDLVGFPPDLVDADLENDLAMILMQVRKLDKKKRIIFISSVKGLLSGIEGD